MEKFLSEEPIIKFKEALSQRWTKIKLYFQQKSGGKTIVALKKVAPVGIVVVLLLALILAWLGPKEDHTYYRQASTARKPESNTSEQKPAVSVALATLFGNGEKKREADQKKEAEDKKRKVSIRYFAQQVLGANSKGPKAIKSGSKLIGVLLSPIDTRAQSIVRVKVPQGGDSSGVVIDRGATLVGQFSYSGNDDKVYLTFSRIDSPEGDSKSINARALDASDYTPGVSGEHFSGGGTKIAANIGLTMFSGMTDTMTQRESLGNSYNGVQAAPSLKNGLLQGLSRASQDQASRTASAIDQAKDYVVVPEGKEMIIELSEDFRK